MPMTEYPFASLQDELAARRAQGLYRQRRVLGSPQSVHIKIDGRTVLAFAAMTIWGWLIIRPCWPPCSPA